MYLCIVSFYGFHLSQAYVGLPACISIVFCTWTLLTHMTSLMPLGSLLSIHHSMRRMAFETRGIPPTAYLKLIM